MMLWRWHLVHSHEVQRSREGTLMGEYYNKVTLNHTQILPFSSPQYPLLNTRLNCLKKWGERSRIRSSAGRINIKQKLLNWYLCLSCFSLQHGAVNVRTVTGWFEVRVNKIQPAAYKSSFKKKWQLHIQCIENYLVLAMV